MEYFTRTGKEFSSNIRAQNVKNSKNVFECLYELVEESEDCRSLCCPHEWWIVPIRAVMFGGRYTVQICNANLTHTCMYTSNSIRLSKIRSVQHSRNFGGKSYNCRTGRSDSYA